MSFYALRGLAQKAQRLASSGISEMHSGHFFVVGSAGGSRRARAIIAFIGFTTRKKIEVATSRNEMIAFTNDPTMIALPLIVSARPEKSGTLTIAASSGV